MYTYNQHRFLSTSQSIAVHVVSASQAVWHAARDGLAPEMMLLLKKTECHVLPFYIHFSLVLYDALYGRYK